MIRQLERDLPELLRISVLLICDFFAPGDEFQAACGMSSRTVERKAVSKGGDGFPPGLGQLVAMGAGAFADYSVRPEQPQFPDPRRTPTGLSRILGPLSKEEFL